MTSRRLAPRLEVLLYLALMMAAAWLRLARLDWPPLNNEEAIQALEALQSTPQASPFWVPADQVDPDSGGYYVLTQLIFQLFGASDSAARVIPALFGIALVLTPLVLRKRIGAASALAACGLLALSPCMIAISRMAGGRSMALFSVALALGLIAARRSAKSDVWAAVVVAMGLALASGPSVWTAILGLAIGFFLLGLSRILGSPSRLGQVEREQWPRWMVWGIPLAASMIAGGMGFSLKGVSALFESLTTWVTGWGGGLGISAWTVLAALPIYDPLLLVFGIAGAILALVRNDPFGRAAVGWGLGALIAAMAYPARHPADLAWVLLPMSVLAARALTALLEGLETVESKPAAGSLAGVLLVMAAFAAMQLVRESRGAPGIFEFAGYRFSLDLPVLSLGLMAIVVVLFALAWSWKLAGLAAGGAAVVVLLALSISANWRLSMGPSAAGAQELWRPQASTPGLPLLVDSLEAAARQVLGRQDSLTVATPYELTPAIAWAIRSMRRADWVDPELRDPVPSLLVPESQEPPALSEEYVGETLATGEIWGWAGPLPSDMLTWWLTRQAPTIPERWMLLLRVDLFDRQVSNP